MKNYAMFSDEGNAEVDALVNDILKLPITASNDEVEEKLKEGFNKIEEDHPEVWDTAVREVVVGTIEKKTNKSFSIYF